MTVPTLHLLGAGRAAQAVARRLFATGRVQPGLVVNRSLRSAAEAARFMGAGEPASALDERLSGGWLMLGLPDGVLGESLEAMAEDLPAPALVFHLSGSIEAEVLRVFRAPVAAVHPVRAFADPELACRNFEGTWCVAEGDMPALDALRPLFEAARGRWLAFDASDKPAWHAATVAASNFLATIQSLARLLADQAGLPQAQAAEILCDLQQGMLDSLRERTPAVALTGPIERGDAAACRRLMASVAQLSPGHSDLFAELGRATLALAREKRGDRETDREIERLFSRSSD